MIFDLVILGDQQLDQLYFFRLKELCQYVGYFILITDQSIQFQIEYQNKIIIRPMSSLNQNLFGSIFLHKDDIILLSQLTQIPDLSTIKHHKLMHNTLYQLMQKNLDFNKSEQILGTYMFLYRECSLATNTMSPNILTNSCGEISNLLSIFQMTNSFQNNYVIISDGGWFISKDELWWVWLNNQITNNRHHKMLFPQHPHMPHYYTMLIDPAPLTVLYGCAEKMVDVTTNFLEQAQMLDDKKQTITINRRQNWNLWFGDPSLGRVKQIIILNGTKFFVISEKNDLRIKINLHPRNQSKHQIIYICPDQYHHYFQDYINSLALVDMEIYYHFDSELINLNYNQPNCVFFIPYRMPKTIPAQKNIFFLNTEQTSCTGVNLMLQRLVRQDYQIIDYSLINCLRYPQSHYLPYQITEIDLAILRQPTDIKFDIGLIGWLTPRRIHIVENLKKIGLSVNCVNGWDGERDRALNQCRLLLNIHYDESRHIFEHFRCDRWIFAGKIVISEVSEQMHLLDIKNAVIWTTYDQMVECVQQTLQKLPITTGQYLSIIERQKYLLDVIHLLDQI